ncbi:hypothetical protein BKH42_06910 [Helicobacter sp. 13S00482-2]|uniref:hypothetical protein n=1 Tax=Helicobacter sp. 13S00482-2 TaxID=1476200 RepID=UPI000BA6AD74|nr:hypothetical protein [Helicobacter sp. 13S00482-2]PAF53252.1 hypothetical protein BKH42_06910 [Helicobacter sp. 13S00482-2]
MTLKQRIQAIDEARDEILNNLKDGIEISEYSIDGVNIKKRSPIEMIAELEKLKKTYINQISTPNSIQLIIK